MKVRTIRLDSAARYTHTLTPHLSRSIGKRSKHCARAKDAATSEPSVSLQSAVQFSGY